MNISNDALTIAELEERFETTVAAAHSVKGDIIIIGTPPTV